MSELTKTIGARIRNYRISLGLSQERVADISGCHPTYIGQVERGEKNATLESISKIAVALNVPLYKLFEHLDATENDFSQATIPLKCYEYLMTKTKSEQESIYSILMEIEKYKGHSN